MNDDRDFSHLIRKKDRTELLLEKTERMKKEGKTLKFGDPMHGGKSKQKGGTNFFERRQQEAAKKVVALPPPQDRLIDFSDGEFITDTFDRVEGLVPMRGRVGILGKYKAGKSVVSTAIGLHIALGIDIGSRNVEQGIVVHVMSEGDKQRNKNRILAWCREHDIDPKEAAKNYIPLGLKYPLSDTPDHLIRDIDHFASGASVVIIDPLIENFQGNENHSEDMSLFMDHIHRVAHHIDGVVIVPHHTGMDASRGARGSTAYEGALDVMLTVSGKANNVEIKSTVSRDSPMGDKLNGKIKKHDIGNDPRGREVSAPVFIFNETEAEQPTERRNETSPEVIQHAMTAACTTFTQQPGEEPKFENRYMTRQEIQDAVTDYLDLDTTKQTHIDRRKNVMRHLKLQAQKEGGVVECEDFDVSTKEQQFRLRLP